MSVPGSGVVRVHVDAEHAAPSDVAHVETLALHVEHPEKARDTARHRRDADGVDDVATAIEDADVRRSARGVEVQRRGVDIAARIDRDTLRKIAQRAELWTEVLDDADLRRCSDGRLLKGENEHQRDERREFLHGPPPPTEGQV